MKNEEVRQELERIANSLRRIADAMAPSTKEEFMSAVRMPATVDTSSSLLEAVSACLSESDLDAVKGNLLVAKKCQTISEQGFDSVKKAIIARRSFLKEWNGHVDR